MAGRGASSLEVRRKQRVGCARLALGLATRYSELAGRVWPSGAGRWVGLLAQLALLGLLASVGSAAGYCGALALRPVSPERQLSRRELALALSVGPGRDIRAPLPHGK